MVTEVARRDCAAGYDEGLLRAYLDGELEHGWLDDVRAHVESCRACADLLVRLRLDGALAQSRLMLLDVDAERAPATRPSAGAMLAMAEARAQRGWWAPLSAAGAWWRDALSPALRPAPLAAGLAAGAVVLIGVAFTQPAVQSFAQGVIQQLRVQKVQPVIVDLAALRGVRAPELDELLGVGTFTGPMHPTARKSTIAEAAKATGLTIRAPSRLPSSVKGGPEVWVSDPATFSFTYDGQKLAQKAQEYGVKDAATLAQLRGLNGATVKGAVPAATALIYGDPLPGLAPASAAPGAKITPDPRAASATPRTSPFLAIIQLKSPSVELPKDVNADQLREQLLRSGAVPPAIANQLLAITDWKNTLPIPVTRGQARQVAVDGTTGTLVVGEAPEPVLIWQKDGTIYVMSTSGGEQELLAAAGSLAPAR